MSRLKAGMFPNPKYRAVRGISTWAGYPLGQPVTPTALSMLVHTFQGSGEAEVLILEC